MSKVLIIEDDEKILRLENDYLTANGFDTVTCADGREGLELAFSEDFDLVLLDIMLPSLNGFEICRQLRSEKNIPIIFVSAKKEDYDKIAGLGFGADDYIVKPFSPAELVARVKAHISRYNSLTDKGTQDGVIEFEGLVMDSASGSVSLKGKSLTMTKKEFDVLYILASQPSAVFGKHELFEKVWGYDSLGDTSTLTVHINRIREKLREADADCDYVKTVWGRGYKLR